MTFEEWLKTDVGAATLFNSGGVQMKPYLQRAFLAGRETLSLLAVCKQFHRDFCEFVEQDGCELPDDRMLAKAIREAEHC
jgi:hypothetical protein